MGFLNVLIVLAKINGYIKPNIKDRKIIRKFLLNKIINNLIKKEIIENIIILGSKGNKKYEIDPIVIKKAIQIKMFCFCV